MMSPAIKARMLKGFARPAGSSDKAFEENGSNGKVA
jgi:hypothetical protein